jgi:anti-sigma factor RsiW
MDHRRYEEWILSDDELTAGDRRALDDHLTACDRCRRLDRNWRAAGGILSSPSLRGPTPGFSARWTRRLEQDDRRRQTRRSLAMVGVGFAGAALSLTYFGVRFLGAIEDFAGPALAQLQDISRLTTAVQTALSAAPGLGEPAAVLILPTAIMLFFTAIGAGAIGWLKMFRLLARVQGFTQWA